MSGSMLQCPRCQKCSGKKIDSQRSVCSACSEELRRVYQFCSACRREWPKGMTGGSSCTLPGCAVRAALMSNQTITANTSSVFRCPFFRACPRCKALLTHTGWGCPNIVCPHCSTRFCFRCLKSGPCFSHCEMVDNSASLRALGV
ncbi:probable E3 ubiquitin-protein ligase RNF144A [Conger conger]|uniref:probable E3 ubiquitin-protein ligase RNF144A n=1 Tax=Conger conger TaxID=82655 RepID=UPI002A59889D|nr:probable E3 ubiquitin-protein ligase RNF144A [Conger conger]